MREWPIAKSLMAAPRVIEQLRDASWVNGLYVVGLEEGVGDNFPVGGNSLAAPAVLAKIGPAHFAWSCIETPSR